MGTIIRFNLELDLIIILLISTPDHKTWSALCRCHVVLGVKPHARLVQRQKCIVYYIEIPLEYIREITEALCKSSAMHSVHILGK